MWRNALPVPICPAGRQYVAVDTDLELSICSGLYTPRTCATVHPFSGQKGRERRMDWSMAVYVLMRVVHQFAPEVHHVPLGSTDMGVCWVVQHPPSF